MPFATSNASNALATSDAFLLLPRTMARQCVGQFLHFATFRTVLLFSRRQGLT